MRSKQRTTPPHNYLIASDGHILSILTEPTEAQLDKLPEMISRLAG